MSLHQFVHSYHVTTSRAYQAYNHSSKSAVPFDSAQDVRYHSRLLDWPSNILGLHTRDRIIHEHFQLQVCRLKRIHENSVLQPFAAKCILSKHAEISAKNILWNNSWKTSFRAFLWCISRTPCNMLAFQSRRKGTFVELSFTLHLCQNCSSSNLSHLVDFQVAFLRVDGPENKHRQHNCL